MQRVLKILRSNYVIALVLTIIIFAFYPKSPKYNVKYRLNYEANSTLFFIDIEEDGESELLKITGNENELGTFYLKSSEGLFLQQTNLTYHIFTEREKDIVVEKSLSDGRIRVMMLAEKNDSLFLLEIVYAKSKTQKPQQKAYFLDYLRKKQNSYQLERNLYLKDTDGDGENELVVAACSGYNIMPRRVYIIDYEENKVFKSPVSGAAITGLIFKDIDGDGKLEILANTSAYCNIYEKRFSILPNNNPHDSILLAQKNNLFRYTDCGAWLMGFNYQLEFLFEPIFFDGWTNTISSAFYVYKNKPAIISVFSNLKDPNFTPQLFISTFNGQRIFKKSLDFSRALGIVRMHDNDLYLSSEGNRYYKILEDVKLAESPIHGNLETHTIMQIDSKRFDEYFTFIKTERGIRVLDSDYDLIEDMNFNIQHPEHAYISSMLLSGNREIVMLDLGNQKIQIQFTTDEYYYLKKMIWILIYFAILLIINVERTFFSYRAVQEKLRFEKIVQERTEEVEAQKENLEGLTKRLKEKNDEVFQQNIEIEKRRKEVEHLYNNLSTSITYAKGVKEALLPKMDIFNTIFSESCIISIPKNIIGGDFFWFAETAKKKIVIIGDTSRESISGGFLSLFVINLISSIDFKEVDKPSMVLKKVNKALYESLSSYFVNENDGIEMAVLFIEKEERNGELKADFSSANLPLHYFPSDKVISMITVEPSDYPIRANLSKMSFEDKTFSLPSKSILYMATKGMYSQVGGEQKEPFGKSQIRTNLMKINVLDLKKQKTILLQEFNNWKEKEEQTGDILCLGIRV